MKNVGMNNTFENIFERKLVAKFLFFKIDMENRKEIPVAVPTSWDKDLVGLSYRLHFSSNTCGN